MTGMTFNEDAAQANGTVVMFGRKTHEYVYVLQFMACMAKNHCLRLVDKDERRSWKGINPNDPSSQLQSAFRGEKKMKLTQDNGQSVISRGG